MFNKKIEAKCKNCVLFNRTEKVCSVIILHEGERIKVPVEAEDDCFYSNKFTALGEEFTPEIEQVRMWVEDPVTGEQIGGNGIVKIQYPKNFFSPNDND